MTQDEYFEKMQFLELKRQANEIDEETFRKLRHQLKNAYYMAMYGTNIVNMLRDMYAPKDQNSVSHSPLRTSASLESLMFDCGWNGKILEEVE